jgi:hypothetical protein
MSAIHTVLGVSQAKSVAASSGQWAAVIGIGRAAALLAVAANNLIFLHQSSNSFPTD